jgi:hypothetical protein
MAPYYDDNDDDALNVKSVGYKHGWTQIVKVVGSVREFCIERDDESCFLHVS